MQCMPHYRVLSCEAVVMCSPPRCLLLVDRVVEVALAVEAGQALQQRLQVGRRLGRG